MFRGTSLWTGLIAGGLYQFEDAKSYGNGEMNKNEYAAKTTTNVASAMGIMAGVEYGAVLGSAVLPGIGTIVGSVVGAIAGDRLGQFVGGQVGGMMFKRTNPNAEMNSYNEMLAGQGMMGQHTAEQGRPTVVQ